MSNIPERDHRMRIEGQRSVGESIGGMPAGYILGTFCSVLMMVLGTIVLSLWVFSDKPTTHPLGLAFTIAFLPFGVFLFVLTAILRELAAIRGQLIATELGEGIGRRK